MTTEGAGYTAYAELYDSHSTGVAGDVEFYRDLALGAEGLVVELGVGTGRIAIPSARAGVRVIGLDLSRAMLAVARRKAATEGLDRRLALVCSDMRRFALREQAALVTIPFRAFLHNLTTEDQLATLRGARSVLRPGGRLALNVFNPDVQKIADALRRGPDAWREGSGPLGADELLGYEPTAQVTRTTWVVRRPLGGSVRFSFVLRYVYRFEMEHLLARAGFEIEALYGDHHRAPFEEHSTEMVWVARRPASAG